MKNANTLPAQQDLLGSILATQEPTVTAPAAPAQEKGGFFSTFFDRAQNDQNFKTGLLQAAAGLLQPIAPGQTALGQGANAILGGVNAFNQGKAADAAARSASVTAERTARSEEAQIDNTVADTKKKQADAIKALREAEIQAKKSAGLTAADLKSEEVQARIKKNLLDKGSDYDAQLTAAGFEVGTKAFDAQKTNLARVDAFTQLAQDKGATQEAFVQDVTGAVAANAPFVPQQAVAARDLLTGSTNTTTPTTTGVAPRPLSAVEQATRDDPAKIREILARPNGAAFLKSLGIDVPNL